MERNTFHWLDYVVFVLVLVGSFGIGMYHAFVGKQRTTEEYLLADRKLGTFPVAMSILVSFISSILIIGFPAEVYHYGAQFLMGNIALIFGVLGAAYVMVPIFYPLKYTSIFEYLRDRYHSESLKQVACALSILGGISFMGVQLFLPAAAVQAASNIPIPVSLIVAGGIATIYTTLGGMKAVVWTDVFQTVIMFAGLIAIFIVGAIKVGGLRRIWEVNGLGDRLNFFDMNPDPTKRMNFWGLAVGNIVFFLYIYGVSQSSTQRYCSVTSVASARRSILIILPGHIIMSVLAVWIGMTVYAFYYVKGCDPRKLGLMDNPNQIVPYFVIENLNYPGFPGLFTACIWAGSLSTISSMLTSMATNLYMDILSKWFVDSTEARKTLITKISVFSFGVLGIGMAFILGNLGGLVYQAAITLSSATFAPLLTLFLMGLFFPFTNYQGAFASVIASFSVCLWIAIGSYTIDKHLEALPVPAHNCSAYLPQGHDLFNGTTPAMDLVGLSNWATTAEVVAATQPRSFFTWFYSISFLWIKFVGVVLGLISGIIVSLITGRHTVADPRLVVRPMIKLFRMTEKEVVADPSEMKPLNGSQLRNGIIEPVLTKENSEGSQV